MIKIIHVSDFHLESENPSHDKKIIVEALITDIKPVVDESTILVMTGDLIDKGAAGFHNNKTAFKVFQELFIDPITQQFPSLQDKIFFVPGNHDVYRTKIDEFSDEGLRKKLTDTKKLDDFINSNYNTSKHLDRLEDYNSWQENFYSSYSNKHQSLFDNNFILTVGDTKIGIACFNSSWLCKDNNDKEQLLVGKLQVQNAISFLKDCKIKIALMHHPLEFIKSFDREIIKPEIFREFNILCTGHVHEIASSYTYDLLGNIFISISNSTIADMPELRKYVNGYTIIELEPSNYIKARYRKYIETSKVFVANTDIGTEDGTKTFPLLMSTNLVSFERDFTIVQHVLNTYTEKLNEHIIMSNDATRVNCAIDDLFVHPTILDTPQGASKEEPEDEYKYKIEDIIKDNSNYLIYGQKESGKTLLLDKMFLESLRNFNQTGKISVLFKFLELKTKKN